MQFEAPYSDVLFVFR
jgi:hypothetical protein